MVVKVVTAVVTVLIGVGAALLLYWVLNKLAESLPQRWEERLKPFLYILPAYAAITLYLIYPAIESIIYSFKDSSSSSWVGLHNYTALLTSHGFQQTLFNTLLWMLIVPTACVVIGLGVAVLTDRLRPRAEKTTKTVIFLPMAISMVGAATVWRFLYAYRPAGQSQIGLQNAIVTGLGFNPVAWLQHSQFHLNSLMLMLMLVWAQVGFSMVLLSAAVKGVPDDTIEAARIDGAGERQIFFRIVVPQIKGTLITVFVTVLIMVMKIFDIVYVMTNGNYNTEVIANRMYKEMFNYRHFGRASAIAVVLLLLIIPVMIYNIRRFREQEALR